MNKTRFLNGLLAKHIVVAVGVVTLQAAVAVAIPLNPAAYFSFDNGTNLATTGNDDSGNGNNGSLINGAVFTAAGKSGGAMSLTSESSQMRINPGGVDIDNVGWTAAAWFKDLDGNGWRTLFRGAGGDHQIIVENGSQRLGMYANGHGNFRPVGPQFDLPSDLTTTADGWHHVAAVGTGGNAGSIAFYVDGAFVGTTDEGSQSDIFAVGNYQGNGQRYALLIDEVYIYQRALTAAEIGELHQMSDGGGVPEPATATLAMLGLGGLMMRRRRAA